VLELIKEWDLGNRAILVTDRKQGIDYVSRLKLQAMDIVAIEAFITKRHNDGNHVNASLIVEHLNTDRAAALVEPGGYEGVGCDPRGARRRRRGIGRRPLSFIDLATPIINKS
jgi:hypothetical protein